jgi:hypothetical protein
MLHDGPTRAERIECEELIDVVEWAEVRGLASPFPFPTALTRALWDIAAALPFHAVGSTSVDERIHAVLQAAERALMRATEPPLDLDPESGFVATFGVALPSRSSDPRWRSLHLLCGPDETGVIVLTIGLAEELKPIPPRRTA